MRYKDEIRITKERMIKFIESNPNWEIDFYSKSKIRNSYFLEMKCKDCEAISKFSVSGISSGNIRCQNCIHIKLAKDFDSLGFEFFGKSGGRCFIGCRGCDTVTIRQTIDYSKRSKIDCSTCHMDQILEILESNGCSFVEKYMDGWNTRIVYLTQDGQENDVAAKQIKENCFAKLKKSESPYRVYMFWKVIENSEIIPDGLYFKIGIAINPELRLKTLNLDFDCNIHVIEECLNRKDAIQKEKEMHDLFWWCKLGKTIPQIFTNRVSSSSLSKRNKKKRCYMKDGVTEWFHLPENVFNFMLRNKESFK